MEREELERIRFEIIRLGLTPEENKRLTDLYNHWMRLIDAGQGWKIGQRIKD